jgi:hypothetical protein
LEDIRIQRKLKNKVKGVNMTTLLLTLFFACGEKEEDSALTEPTSEPAEETTEDTSSEEQTEETGSTEEEAEDTATSEER